MGITNEFRRIERGGAGGETKGEREVKEKLLALSGNEGERSEECQTSDGGAREGETLPVFEKRMQRYTFVLYFQVFPIHITR
jgi:hypothetical protein